MQVLASSEDARTELLANFIGPSPGCEMLPLVGLGLVNNVFGYLKDGLFAGPELLGLGSFRATADKSSPRRVVMAEFAPLQLHIQRQLNLPAAPSIPKMNKFVLDCTQEQLDAMGEAGVQWHLADCGELSLIYTPPGWYMVEKPLNGVVCGFQVALAPASSRIAANYKVGDTCVCTHIHTYVRTYILTHIHM